MTIKENKNFLSVKEFYMPLTMEDVESQLLTSHLSEERKERFEKAFRLNRVYAKDKSFVQSPVDKVFLVDKGHKDGKEIHIISKKGIIFILNEDKFLNGKNSFITILLGRPNQVRRLYDAVGAEVSEKILDCCRNWEKKGLNV